MPDIRHVQPGELHLPPEREDGADPFKLTIQRREFGSDVETMPTVLVVEGANGALQIYNGVTRATRAHITDPARTIPVEVIAVYASWDFSQCPTVADQA